MEPKNCSAIPATNTFSEYNNFCVQLAQKFPNLHFSTSDKFKFIPPDQIFYGPPEPHFQLLALHEVGHALCGRFIYDSGVERLKIERAAWEEAKRLCPEFGVVYDEDFVEDQLDTYRDWLHQISVCPTCGLTGYEVAPGEFRCPHCDDLLS